MNKKKLLGVALSAALAFSFSASPANAVVLEADTCTLTLPEKVIYNQSEFNFAGIEGRKDSQSTFQSTMITAGMVACTGGLTPDVTSSWTFRDANTESTNSIRFRSSTSLQTDSYLQWNNILVTDAVSNDYTYVSGWFVSGDSGTFDVIASNFPYNQPHINIYDEVSESYKSYRLLLAKAFTLQNGFTQSSSACIVTMPTLTRHFDESNEANRTLLPLSNFKCPSEIMGHEVFFEDVAFMTADEQDWNYLGSCSDQRVDVATKFAYREQLGMCMYADGDGVFTKARGNIIDNTTGVEYPVVLAAPYKDKYATDVTAKVKKKGSTLTIKINADRNQSLWNGRDTYKRQTVLVREKADRAIVKRGNKVIATVKLSIYGNGTVKIKDIAGKNNYTVTLVETDWNHAGVASFKK